MECSRRVVPLMNNASTLALRCEELRAAPTPEIHVPVGAGSCDTLCSGHLHASRSGTMGVAVLCSTDTFSEEGSARCFRDKPSSTGLSRWRDCRGSVPSRHMVFRPHVRNLEPTSHRQSKSPMSPHIPGRPGTQAESGLWRFPEEQRIVVLGSRCVQLDEHHPES